MRKASKLALAVTVVVALSQTSCGMLNQQETQTAGTTAAVATLAKQLLSSQSSNSGSFSSLLNNPLVTALTGNLGVSGQEAATGTAALLALASNQLGSTQNTELGNVVPQLSAFQNLIPENLSSQLNTLSSVKTLFSGIGLDTSASEKMAPVLIDSIGKAGGSADLISSLTNLWG